MAKWFKYKWAESGDKTAIPDTTDPSGYVSYQQGYGTDYQRALGTDPLAKAIERQKMNQVLNDMTGAIQQYQMNGFPDYIDATTNGGTAYAYAIGAVVRFTDNKNYMNTVASNTDAPDVSGWIELGAIENSIHNATAKTTPVNGDEFGIADSADSFSLKKITWTNIKATLKTYFDTLYQAILVSGTNIKTINSTSLLGSGDIAITTPYATQAENIAGTIENKSVDPLGIREAFNATGTAPVYACRAWVNFNGIGTIAIRASGNVSSITDNGVGKYVVNLITAMEDINGAVLATQDDIDTAIPRSAEASFVTTSTIKVDCYGGGSTFVAADAGVMSVAVFR